MTDTPAPGDPGPLLAQGRDAEIFDLGDGTVLRRARNERPLTEEARVMEWVVDHGYPCPRVHELRAGDTEMVMDRIDGPMMMAKLSRRPWSLRRQAATLAELHKDLHALPVPGFLDAVGEGDSLLHNDLHPMNVMLSPEGPVVIDWPSAARGPAEADVAVTWLLMGSAAIPAPPVVRAILGRFRHSLTESFIGHFDRAAVARVLAEVAEERATDRNLSAAEVAAMRAMTAREQSA